MSTETPPTTRSATGEAIDDIAFAGMTLVVYGTLDHLVDWVWPPVIVGATLLVAAIVGDLVTRVRRRG